MDLITSPIPAATSNAFGRSDTEDALPSEVFATYPMTRAQQGLWIAYKKDPHLTLYNLTMKFHISNERNDAGNILNCILEGLHSILFNVASIPRL
jgi:hypothetical protein